MATVTYNFLPGSTVWHITDDCGIKEATVEIVDARIVEAAGSPPLSTVLTYSIQYDGENGTVEVEGEDKLFALLTDALTAYQAILEA